MCLHCALLSDECSRNKIRITLSLSKQPVCMSSPSTSTPPSTVPSPSTVMPAWFRASFAARRMPEASKRDWSGPCSRCSRPTHWQNSSQETTYVVSIYFSRGAFFSLLFDYLLKHSFMFTYSCIRDCMCLIAPALRTMFLFSIH